MTDDLTHADVFELLGAYALDAVEPEEAVLVEAHVATCPRCASELADLREVAGRLGDMGGDAPADLWSIIESQATSPPSSDHPEPVLHFGAPVQRGRRRAVRAVGATIAAAAAVALVLMAVRIGTLDGDVGSLRAQSASLGLMRAAEAALLNPAASRVTLTADGTPGPAVVELVVVPGGHSFLVESKLASLPRSHTYQLWAVDGDQKISLGLLGTTPVVVPFVVNQTPRGLVFAITVEPAAGSAAPTTTPIAVST